MVKPSEIPQPMPDAEECFNEMESCELATVLANQEVLSFLPQVGGVIEHYF